MTAQERQTAIEMAIGRIFGMMQRPHRDGDVAEYERCRAIVLSLTDPTTPDYAPDYARDYAKGSGT